MGAHKGNNYNPNGRPVGAVNKATRTAREAIATFVEDNADRLVEWLDRIAENDPEAAFKAYMSVVEYHIPRLQRSDIDLKIKEVPQARVYPIGIDNEQHNRLPAPPETVDGVLKPCN